MISVDNGKWDLIEELTNQMLELAALPNLTKKQERQSSILMSAISGLKAGATAEQMRNWSKDQLLKASGLPRLPERGQRGWLPDGLDNEYRQFGKGGKVRETSIPKDSEIRANEAGTQSLTFTQQIPGGAFVAGGMSERAFGTMKMYNQIFDEQFSNVIETETGANTPFPCIDDVTNASVQVGETTQSAEVDIANFGEIQLNAYAFRSKIVGVSLELLQDSNFPIGAVLERVFAMRHARGVGAALINGTGVAQPTGLVTAVIASGASPVIAAGSVANDAQGETGATTIGTQDINTLYHKLDPAYRSGAVFYMNDSTLSYLEGLLDKQGHSIVRFGCGLNDDYGPTPYIHSRPVCICPNIANMASGINSVFFGNPLYFVQRRVPSSMYIRRFWENPTLVQFGLVGFESWMRVDSGLVAPNASFLPFQFIQQHS